MKENQNNKARKIQIEDKEKQAKELFNILFIPMSRRMGATELGFKDQTYMVTQIVYDWIKNGKAQVIGIIKCKRSKRWVQKITTNPELFNEQITNQLSMF